MKCPHCEKDIDGISCSQCNAANPEIANYCMECGALLRGEKEKIVEDENGFDFEDRVLCSDGTCTGIIIDGKCSECGKVPGSVKPD